MGYQKTSKIDIKNIDKNIKKIWRPIYDVIYISFFEETEKFPQHFLELYKRDPNQPQFLPSAVKKVLKIMDTEQG